jgi:hypothetical protein
MVLGPVKRKSDALAEAKKAKKAAEKAAASQQL